MIQELEYNDDYVMKDIFDKINEMARTINRNANHRHPEHVVYGPCPLEPIGPGTINYPELEMSDEMKKSYDEAIKNPMIWDEIKEKLKGNNPLDKE